VANDGPEHWIKSIRGNVNTETFTKNNSTHLCMSVVSNDTESQCT